MRSIPAASFGQCSIRPALSCSAFHRLLHQRRCALVADPKRRASSRDRLPPCASRRAILAEQQRISRVSAHRIGTGFPSPLADSSTTAQSARRIARQQGIAQLDRRRSAADVATAASTSAQASPAPGGNSKASFSISCCAASRLPSTWSARNCQRCAARRAAPAAPAARRSSRQGWRARRAAPSTTTPACSRALNHAALHGLLVQLGQAHQGNRIGGQRGAIGLAAPWRHRCRACRTECGFPPGGARRTATGCCRWPTNVCQLKRPSTVNTSRSL